VELITQHNKMILVCVVCDYDGFLDIVQQLWEYSTHRDTTRIENTTSQNSPLWSDNARWLKTYQSIRLWLVCDWVCQSRTIHNNTSRHHPYLLMQLIDEFVNLCATKRTSTNLPFLQRRLTTCWLRRWISNKHKCKICKCECLLW